MTGSSSTPSEKSAPTTPLDGLALHPTPDLIQHQQHQPATHQQLHPQLQQILLGNSEPVFLRRESHNAYAGRVVQQQLSPRDHSYFISNSARRQGRSLDPQARHNKNGVVAGAVPPTNTNNNNNNNNTILLRNSSPPPGVITDALAALTLPRNNSQPSSSDVVGDVPDIAVTAPPAPEELLSFLSGNVSDRRASYRPINRPSTTSSTPPSAPSAGNLPPTEAATNNTTSAIPNGTWQRTPNIEVHHPPPSIHDDAHLLTTEDTLPSVLGVGGADHRTLQSMSPRERLDTASPPTLGFTSSRNVFSPNPHTSAPQHVDGVGGAERITSTSAGPDGGERVVVFPYHFSGKGGGDALHINPLQHARDRQGSPLPPPSPTDVVNPDNAHVPPSRRSSGAEIPSTTHVGDDRPSDPSTTHDGTQGKEQHGEAHNNSSVLNYDIDVKRRYSRHLQPEHSIMSEGGAEATMFEDSSARYSPSIITGTTSRHEFVQLSSTTILPRILRPNPLLDDGIGESDDGIHPRVFGVPSNLTSPSSSPHANATTQHVHVVASSSPATTPPTDDERPLIPEVSVLRSAALSPSLSEVDATTTTTNNNPHSRLLMDIANVPPSQYVLRMEELDENPAEVFTSLQAYLEHAAQLPSSPKFVEEARIINNNKNSNNAIARASYEQPPLGASNVEPQQQNRKLTRWMEDEPSVAGRASVHSRLDLTHTSCASSLYPLAGSPLAEEMKNFPHVVGDGITGSMHLSSSSSSSCTPRATTNLPSQDALQVHGDVPTILHDDVPPFTIEAPHPPPSSLSSTDNIQPATATYEKQASVHGTGTPVEATQHDDVGHPPYSSTNHGPLYAVSMWQPPSSRSSTPDDEDPPRHSAAVHHHHHDAAPPATREYQRGNGDHQRHRQHHRAHPLVPLPPIRKERNGVRPFWIHHPTIRGDDGPWKLVPLPKRYTRAAML